MKNSFLILIISAILTGTLLTSCGLSGETKKEIENIPEIIEENTDKTVEEEKEAPDYSAQIELIANNAKTWFDAEKIDLYSYCITDLDKNGRLEVIISSIGGTGMFSSGNIYEVDKDLDGIVLCGEKGSLNVDIIMFNVYDVYTDENSGKRYYAVYDSYSSGWAEQGSSKYVLSLENSVYETKAVARYLLLTDDNFNETAYYYDIEGNEVTEKYYDNCYSSIFEGYNKSTATFGWIDGEKDENWNCVIPEHDELVSLLTKSFDIFENN